VYPFFFPFYFKAQLISPFLLIYLFIYPCGGSGFHIESACLREREKGQKFHPKKKKKKHKKIHQKKGKNKKNKIKKKTST
jgi:hypothetical protein